MRTGHVRDQGGPPLPHALRRGSPRIQAEPFPSGCLEELWQCARHDKVRSAPDEGVFIGNPTARTITYTRVSGAAVMRAKLRNLEEFLLAMTDLDPLCAWRWRITVRGHPPVHRWQWPHRGASPEHPVPDHAGLLRIPVLT